MTLEIPIKIDDSFWLEGIYECRVRNINITCNGKGVWHKTFRAFRVINNKVSDYGYTFDIDDVFKHLSDDYITDVYGERFYKEREK